MMCLVELGREVLRVWYRLRDTEVRLVLQRR